MKYCLSLLLILFTLGIVNAEQYSPETKFEWSGFAKVICNDGQCKIVGSSGFVFASSTKEAQWKASIEMRIDAKKYGDVVNDTVSVRVSVSFWSPHPRK